ncbi:SMC family ATPase [Candidatus Woesearchaeota archaeon]|nr:SMC family ATPase [Candidatus Woesearchaeota archaeon]
MQLHQLTLHNIRSYQHQTIDFQPGITLLAGDIGVGKSTILLAIEFALFGSSRTELPAELLLRKGTTNGYVELVFSLQQDQITIKRPLKKENETIKQLAGHIIRNDIKKELMPVELKSEVLTLLGYPQEVLSKTKNYLYRFTVYTPQEEMKLILEQDAQSRLDILRKIFNIDKYKTIRENTQSYLKTLRSRITISKTKAEPLAQYQTKEQATINLRKEKEQEIVSIKPIIQEIEKEKANIKEKRNLIELEYQKALQLRNEKSTLSATLTQIEKQIHNYEQQYQQITQKIALLSPEPRDILLIQQELGILETQQREIIATQASLQQLCSQIQKQIEQVQQEYQIILKELETLTQKEEFCANLEQKRLELLKKIQSTPNLQETYSEIVSKIAQVKTILAQIEKIEKNFHQLDNCPTCLQQVKPEYKEQILQTEQHKKQENQEKLTLFEQQLKQINENIRVAAQEQQQLVQIDQEHIKIRAQLSSLYEKRTKQTKIEEQRSALLSQNNAHMSKLNIIQKEEKEINRTQKIKELRIHLEEEQIRKSLLEQSTQLTSRISSLRQEKEQCQIQHQKVDSEYEKYRDISIKVEECRKEEEKNALEQTKQALLLTKLETEYTSLEESLKEITTEIARLTIEKQNALSLQQTSFWLEEHFLPLTLTIEKHVMVTIHQLFAQLFQDWFSILMQDDTITARIDETFNPIIEQNGYEVTFSNLSGGEKTSCALAYRLALNRVINDVIHEIKTKDFLILDEPTDGFSSEQLDRVRDVLEKLGLRQIILVSHEAKIESFVDHVIRVRKQDHVSELW